MRESFQPLAGCANASPGWPATGGPESRPVEGWLVVGA